MNIYKVTADISYGNGRARWEDTEEKTVVARDASHAIEKVRLWAKRMKDRDYTDAGKWTGRYVRIVRFAATRVEPLGQVDL